MRCVGAERRARLRAASGRAGDPRPAGPLRRLRRLAGRAYRLLRPARRGIPDALTCHVTPAAAPPDAPVVLHAIANLMTGGSSRLVVDLIERLGGYRHAVLTRFAPDPPAYLGVDLTEMPGLPEDRALDTLFLGIRPSFLHLHYWGECDEPWYQAVIAAARRHKVPVLENVNTPVHPLVSPCVKTYVYVSDYVRRRFGRGTADEVVIHPGSDFDLFSGDPVHAAGCDAVGMVYRLERDKLDPRSIDPLIALSRRGRSTRIVVVGGGSLLVPFRDAVEGAGAAERFEFPGYVAYAALPDWYRRFGLFVAPVFKESFGQVAPFAMSMGIPVVGYDTGAITEIIGDPGLVAPTGDHEGLAAIAARLLADPQRRLAEGRRQQERARRLFSVGAMVAAYRGVYAAFEPRRSSCG